MSQPPGDSNQELTARLEATSRLSKTAIWQLRLTMALVTVVAVLYLAISLTVGNGIDMGVRDEKPLFAIFDGRELGRTLHSHVATFTSNRHRRCPRY